MNIRWQTDRALDLVKLEMHTMIRSGIVDWSDVTQIRTLSTLYGLRQVTAFLDYYGAAAVCALYETTLWIDVPFDDNILAEINADYCGARPMP